MTGISDGAFPFLREDTAKKIPAAMRANSRSNVRKDATDPERERCGSLPGSSSAEDTVCFCAGLRTVRSRPAGSDVSAAGVFEEGLVAAGAAAVSAVTGLTGAAAEPDPVLSARAIRSRNASRSDSFIGEDAGTAQATMRLHPVSAGLTLRPSLESVDESLIS